MKTWLFLIFLALPSLSFAQSHNDDIFSPQIRTSILMAIDNLCTDTWCEGEYDFKFNEFKCNKEKRRCELRFQFIKIDEDYNKTLSTHQVCSFENISKLGQILLNENDLNQSFFEDLTDCIHKKERSVIF